MKPINKKEANIIKKRINKILEDFDQFNRHQLREKLIRLGKFCYPHSQEAKL